MSSDSPYPDLFNNSTTTTTTSIDSNKSGLPGDGLRCPVCLDVLGKEKEELKLSPRVTYPLCGHWLHADCLSGVEAAISRSECIDCQYQKRGYSPVDLAKEAYEKEQRKPKTPLEILYTKEQKELSKRQLEGMMELSPSSEMSDIRTEWTLQFMYDNNITLTDLQKKAGVTVAQLYHAFPDDCKNWSGVVTFLKPRKSNFRSRELMNLVHAAHLYKINFRNLVNDLHFEPVEFFKEAQITLKELGALGMSMTDLISYGFTKSNLMEIVPLLQKTPVRDWTEHLNFGKLDLHLLDITPHDFKQLGWGNPTGFAAFKMNTIEVMQWKVPTAAAAAAQSKK